ncbi:MAG: dihydrolipoamide acetyltransferase family protein [Thermoanaerobaculia bacterium]|jgi:pyruvate dehydrogenase E2 component (dihydrolipoamide acetyltransferase)
MGEIIMPKMGDAMTEGRVVRWHKKSGDKVTKGEAVLEIETDKVNLDLEAEEDGLLDNIAFEAGAMAPVGAVLATVGLPHVKQADKPAAAAVTAPAAAAPVPAKKASGEFNVHDKKTAEQEIPSAIVGRRRSSPLARKIAAQKGVDLALIAGSGPGGRIVASDVESARAGSRVTPSSSSLTSVAALPVLETKVVPLSAMRRTIAKRLAESIGPIPHFFLTVDLDVTKLVQLREQVIEITGVKASLNDFVVRASALALRSHPLVNASFGEEAITLHGEVHVGVAVATPEGLLTPVIRNADRKSVVEIATEVRALAEKARARKLMPDEYQGSSFTISNLGMYGIEEFTAIINPPNAAILAIGAAMQKPVVEAGQVVVRDRMKVTMSCDHRVVDGAVGADFLRTFRQYVEQPLRLMI